jgi:hypothetical protein
VRIQIARPGRENKSAPCAQLTVTATLAPSTTTAAAAVDTVREVVLLEATPQAASAWTSHDSIDLKLMQESRVTLTLSAHSSAASSAAALLYGYDPVVLVSEVLLLKRSSRNRSNGR